MGNNWDTMMASHQSLARVIEHWRAGAWVGAHRRAFGPLAEVNETDDQMIVDTHPPHSLIVLWPPPRDEQPLLRRLPQVAALMGTHDEAELLGELLSQLPVDARLWLAPQPEVDWALMAEIVMISEPGLEPYQHRELRRFIDDERVATLALISTCYTDDARSYEPFVQTVRGGLEPQA